MPLREDLLNPIPGENPSGANLRYDPVTDKIKEARREDIDAPQGEWKTALKTADYNQVAKLAGDAIAKRSKDLQLAVWLVDAYVRKEGFTVLAPAFQFLHDLIEQYWDTLYPPVDEDGDMEVRAAPLEWLGTKLGEPLGFVPIVSGKLSWLSYQESRTVGYEADADTQEKAGLREQRIGEGKVTGEQFDEAFEATPLEALRKTRKDIEEGLAALEELSQFCDEKFSDFAPSFIKTRTALEEIGQTVKILIGRKPGGNEEEDATSAVDSGFDMSLGVEEAAATGGPAAPQVASLPAGAPADPAGAARQLAAICRFLRSQDPEDPTPYLLMRAWAWGKLQLAAPMIDRSSIEAPPGDLRVNIRKAAAEGDYDKVLDLTESAMLQPFGRTWLDMQRYAVQAIEQKGFSGTARVVNNYFRILLEMLPDILDVTLPDDTPCANSETKNWIENFVIIQKVPRGEPAPAEDTSSSDFSMDSTESTESTDFSTETPVEEPSLDGGAEATAAAPALEPEPEPFTPEENPPILEAEEPPPSDLADEFAQALYAVRNGKTEDGLAVITSLLATETSGRARFRRRTQLAHLLMTAGKGKVAQPILDQLAQEIEDRRLEDWERSEDLAYPLELLLRSLARSDEERRAALYARICKLDPVRAVNCPL